jgi:TRAP-type C4-dicarboxylate transport system permease small subunit
MVAFRTGRLSAVMGYPLWIAMLFIPSGLVLMAFFMVVELIKQKRGKGERVQEGPPDISGEISH